MEKLQWAYVLENGQGRFHLPSPYIYIDMLVYDRFRMYKTRYRKTDLQARNIRYSHKKYESETDLQVRTDARLLWFGCNRYSGLREQKKNKDPMKGTNVQE
jgi:hypothetical protein